ncbi:hypothetical protein ABI_40070 [Asticcacaulis biprosthecium C19]|uniref:Uncharacterized protein n=1 Tax=Asticcacaulis biprosthecium C19 TaxID=715226 RepID=F4QS70_9CAUL|nr:hypothetical protein ABI_40070 [Asticcacaulis biprosthecium C19]
MSGNELSTHFKDAPNNVVFELLNDPMVPPMPICGPHGWST